MRTVNFLQIFALSGNIQNYKPNYNTEKDQTVFHLNENV